MRQGLRSFDKTALTANNRFFCLVGAAERVSVLNPRLHPLEVHLSCTTVIKLCAEDQPEESCTLNL